MIISKSMRTWCLRVTGQVVKKFILGSSKLPPLASCYILPGTMCMAVVIFKGAHCKKRILIPTMFRTVKPSAGESPRRVAQAITTLCPVGSGFQVSVQVQFQFQVPCCGSVDSYHVQSSRQRWRAEDQQGEGSRAVSARRNIPLFRSVKWYDLSFGSGCNDGLISSIRGGNMGQHVVTFPCATHELVTSLQQHVRLFMLLSYGDGIHQQQWYPLKHDWLQTIGKAALT